MVLDSNAISSTSSSSDPAAAGSHSSRTSTSHRPFETVTSCEKCKQQLSLLLRPKFVHESTNIIGSLKPQGCVPVDLLPSTFAAQCADCSAVVALRSVQVRQYLTNLNDPLFVTALHQSHNACKPDWLHV